MARLPKLAVCTIGRVGRPGKTITRAVPDRSGFRGSKQKEQFQP
jgi:hypothetical protein